MCTAISFSAGDHYFGRNLDLEYSFRESVTVCPRNYLLPFVKMPKLERHYAMIGMAFIQENYPLYYDATNEHGISMAALNFPGNAVYHGCEAKRDNIAPFELIPWVLGQCKSLSEAIGLLERASILKQPFSKELPLTPLHWLMADSKGSVVAEPTADGLRLYENPIHVLTNNPPFPYHLTNLENYLNLTAKEPTDRFADSIPLCPYSRGMGALGLPGDLSSASRFVRAAFTLHNAHCEKTENAAMSQFFHILGSVEQQEGCVQLGDRFEKTVYSSCCNTDKGVYYYRTYSNSQITAVDMHREDLESNQLIDYPLRNQQCIYYQN